MADPTPGVLSRIDAANIRADVDALARDLPRRTLNSTRPGVDRCTLYEADDYVVGQLQAAGYDVEREPVEGVRAFRTDRSKPMPHQFSQPDEGDPSYTAFNLYARTSGTVCPDEVLVAIAHKDSQSWTDSPGAHDNAAGTAGTLEMARALTGVETRCSVWFVFCNEEHTPWTSVVVANGLADSDLHVRGVVNVDSIGGRAPADVEAGRFTHVTRYTTPEGKELAQRTASLNERYDLGLVTDSFEGEHPNDDDGSFIKAGIPNAVLHIGSYPYANEDYHAHADTADKIDCDLLARSARVSLALLLDLDKD